MSGPTRSSTGVQDPPTNTDPHEPDLPPGSGNSKHSAMWSTALIKNPTELPGFIVDTMYTGTVRWLRVTASEAREWAQCGATIYHGYTLDALDRSELPPGPMPNPAPPPQSTAGQAVEETARQIEEQLDRSRDGGYENIQQHHATPPDSPAKKISPPTGRNSSSTSSRDGSSVFSA